VRGVRGLCHNRCTFLARVIAACCKLGGFRPIMSLPTYAVHCAIQDSMSLRFLLPSCIVEEAVLDIA
jgi:hypothetical protein